VPESDIAAKLATQPSGRFRWSEAHYLDADAVLLDQRRIERFYRAQGYYSARVVRVDLPAVGDREVRVRFQVEEGLPVRVGEIRIEGGEAAPEAEASGLDPLALIEAEHYARVRPVGAPSRATPQED
jgi:outer membrane protein assembly factor BamA